MSEIFCINEIDAESISRERNRVKKLLSSILASDLLHEVGSTAIEGAIGKQDIDFLVRAPESEFVDIRKLLDTHFQRNPDQLSNDIYQGYNVESDLDVAIQLTVEDGPYDNFLDFRNQIRSNPELKSLYNQLKRQYNGRSMEEYRDAKNEFIQSTLKSM